MPEYARVAHHWTVFSLVPRGHPHTKVDDQKGNMRRSANYISAQKPRIGSAQSFPVAARVPSRLPLPLPSRVRSVMLASELEK